MGASNHPWIMSTIVYKQKWWASCSDNELHFDTNTKIWNIDIFNFCKTGHLTFAVNPPRGSREAFGAPAGEFSLLTKKSAKLPWHHSIRLSFWSFCLLVFLSFCQDITLIKLMKGPQSPRSPFVSKILKWQSGQSNNCSFYQCSPSRSHHLKRYFVK